jgi:Xaa-Pro dipeptidase
MRCVCIGPIEESRRHAARTLAEIQDRQIAAMRPGAEARDLDAILRGGVLDAGLRDSFDNISGYTLGFYAPMGPRTSDFTRIFHPYADWRLKAGMVFPCAPRRPASPSARRFWCRPTGRSASAPCRAS